MSVYKFQDWFQQQMQAPMACRLQCLHLAAKANKKVYFCTLFRSKISHTWVASKIDVRTTIVNRATAACMSSQARVAVLPCKIDSCHVIG